MVYTIRESWDQLWLDTVLEKEPDWTLVDVGIDAFLSDVCEQENYPKILYSRETHQEVVPQIVTLAGLLSDRLT